jgi:hypothetical protein
MPTPPTLPKDLTKAAWNSIKPKASAVPVALAAVEARYAAIPWDELPHKEEGWTYDQLKGYPSVIGQHVKNHFLPLKKQLETLRAAAASDAKTYKLGNGKADSKEAGKITVAANKFELALEKYVAALATEHNAYLQLVDAKLKLFNVRVEQRRAERKYYEDKLVELKNVETAFAAFQELPGRDLKGLKQYQDALALHLKAYKEYSAKCVGKSRSSADGGSADYGQQYAPEKDWKDYDSFLNVTAPLNKKLLTHFDKLSGLIQAEEILLGKISSNAEDIQKELDAIFKEFAKFRSGKQLAPFDIERIKGGMKDNFPDGKHRSYFESQIKLSKSNAKTAAAPIPKAEAIVKKAKGTLDQKKLDAASRIIDDYKKAVKTALEALKSDVAQCQAYAVELERQAR